MLVLVLAGFSPEISYTWCKMNKCQLAIKLHMVLINLHLVLAILLGLQVCTKSLNLHLVVWQWYKFTHGGTGSSRYQCYTWCSHQVCYTLARTLSVSVGVSVGVSV